MNTNQQLPQTKIFRVKLKVEKENNISNNKSYHFMGNANISKIQIDKPKKDKPEKILNVFLL